MGTPSPLFGEYRLHHHLGSALVPRSPVCAVAGQVARRAEDAVLSATPTDSGIIRSSTSNVAPPIVALGKSAHPQRCGPARLGTQFSDSVLLMEGPDFGSGLLAIDFTQAFASSGRQPMQAALSLAPQAPVVPLTTPMYKLALLAASENM